MSKDAKEESLILIDSPSGLMIGKNLGLSQDGNWLITQQLCLYADGAFIPVNMPLIDMDITCWSTEVTKLSVNVILTYTVMSSEAKHKVVIKYLDYLSTDAM